MLLGIKKWLNGKRALVHNGDMFHMRCVPHILNLIVKSGLGCVPHILNLIVKSGLEMFDHLVEKIQKTAKYIGSSAQRDEKLTFALSQTKLNTKRHIPYDVDTRWNSTYEMIAAALELRTTIDRLKELDLDFKCLPSELEWENGTKVCDCLKIFSYIMKKHSGVKYPTTNLYFIDVIQIRRSIKMWAESDDDWISAIGNKMQLIFDKYWEECNKLLTIAVIIDTRYKVAIVSYAYRGIFDIHAEFHVDEICEFLLETFNEYSEKFASSGGFVDNSGNASFGSSSSVGGEWLGAFQDFIAINNLRENTRKGELDEYLEEGLFLMEKEVKFDILHWWKLNGPKFPILTQMARDILAIPTSSVASKNSFSKCRRIITDTRSSLNDDSIETLMCVKDWLPELKDGNQSGKTSEDDIFNDLDNEWDLDF
ncbi:zinc finger BED domain-containing protein RICESLEEPER 2-like [Apium graveolens]|uniref:zinc finger BED domain-containing protein RICESLEEPER 2-like n=1 Tax=Apium graveolens TaxID=4045 RepID=UPI003D7BDBB1